MINHIKYFKRIDNNFNENTKVINKGGYMIKVIAFDFVGVLVNEKDIELSNIEEKLERMFGPNLDDSTYLCKAKKLIKNDSNIINITYDLIDKLYKVKDENIFKKIKENYNNIKIIIATNHVSFVRKYINKSFNVDYLDDIIISAEINEIKPNSGFYKYILNKYKINPCELLFIDDNNDNIKGAEKIGIKTIKVEKNTDIFKEINLIIKSL